MFSRYRRAMTDAERAMLRAERDEQLHRLRPSDFRLWIALIAAGVLAALTPWLGLVGWVLAFIFLLVGLPGVYLAYSGHRLGRSLQAELEEVLAAGQVDARKIEALSVAEIHEIGNFAAYVFDVGGGLLYLHPRHLAPEDDNAPWPSNQFEMVSTTDGEALVLYSQGTSLVPMRDVDALDLDPRDLPWLDTFHGNLASLEDDLRRYVRARAEE